MKLFLICLVFIFSNNVWASSLLLGTAKEEGISPIDNEYLTISIPRSGSYSILLEDTFKLSNLSVMLKSESTGELIQCSSIHRPIGPDRVCTPDESVPADYCELNLEAGKYTVTVSNLTQCHGHYLLKIDSIE